jgi:hypothetical protein
VGFTARTINLFCQRLQKPINPRSGTLYSPERRIFASTVAKDTGHPMIGTGADAFHAIPQIPAPLLKTSF